MSYEEARNKFQASFQESLSTVQAHSEKFQHDYLQPAMEKARVFSLAKPITAVFLFIFMSMSLLPAITFLGLSVFVLSTLLFIAISSALLTASAIISLLGACLLVVLALAFLASLVLTSLTVVTYLFFRLVVLFRTEPTPQLAANKWFTELVKGVVSRIPIKVEKIDVPPEGFDMSGTRPAEGSRQSPEVVVTKVEGET